MENRKSSHIKPKITAFDIAIDLKYIATSILTNQNVRWRKNPDLRREEMVLTGTQKKYYKKEAVNSDEESDFDDDPDSQEVRKKSQDIANDILEIAMNGGDNSLKNKIIGVCKEAGLTGIPLLRRPTSFRREFISYDTFNEIADKYVVDLNKYYN